MKNIVTFIKSKENYRKLHKKVNIFEAYYHWKLINNFKKPRSALL